MSFYQAYGLVFSSDIELPELLTTEGPPDVSIRIAPLSEGEPCAESGGLCVEAQYPDLLRFRVRDGNSITLDPIADLEPRELRTYLLGTIMSIVLRQRGYFALHASSLAKNGRAIAFVGDSGWGKSTLAGFFVQQGGYKLINDDVLALDLNHDPILALPGFAQIKFRPDAETWIGERYDTMAKLHGRSPKKVEVEPSQLNDGPVPLERLYLLEPVARDQSRITDIKDRDALLELIVHTRVTNVMDSAQVKAAHFKDCEKLIRGLTIKRLERKRDLNALNDILTLVEEDLAH